jgi:enoyl-CoA hydratase/carnithine racemase
MASVTSSRDGAVVTIALDRVSEGNLLTVDGVRELAAAFRAAGSTDAKVIALRGNGADFCRGRDPKGGAPSPTAMKMRANVCEPILDVYDAMSASAAPSPACATSRSRTTPRASSCPRWRRTCRRRWPCRP